MNMFGIMAATALVLTPVTVSAATVQNGSFEMDPGTISQGVNGHGKGRDFSGIATPGGSSWGIWTDIPGWDVSSNGIELQTERTLGFTPYVGDYYVEMDTLRNTTISQNVFLEAGVYELSFAYSPRTKDASTNGVAFSVADLFGSVSGPDATYGRLDWSKITSTFTVDTADTYLLSFSGTGTSNSYGGLIDDVAISAVPLPGGLALLGGALAGFGALRRRKTT